MAGRGLDRETSRASLCHRQKLSMKQKLTIGFSDRAQCEIVRADCDGKGCGRSSAPDRHAGRCVAGLDADPTGPLTGPLNLGVIPTLAPYFLPRLLPLAKRHYKRLQLVVHEDLTGHLLERLRGYQIDAAPGGT
jgi:hypothetical protein